MSPGGWQNRIVEQGEADPNVLLPNPLNWRAHPAEQSQVLESVLETVGWVDRIIVNKRTGRLVDGHLRVALAKRRGIPQVPVSYVDLSEEEERLVLATFDPITGMALAEQAVLNDLLEQVSTDNPVLQGFLDAMAAAPDAELEQVPDDWEQEEQGPALQSPPEALREKWGTALGQLWTVPSRTLPGGSHRLVCGDAANSRVVARLMGRHRGRWMWTDPPYGVDYTGRTKDQLKIQNDLAGGLGELLANAFRLADRYLVEGAPVYIAHPAGPLSLVFGATVLAVGWHFHETLVWVKNSMVPGHSDYHYKHEPVMYVSKGERLWYPDSGEPGGQPELPQVVQQGLRAKGKDPADYPNRHGFILYGWKGKGRKWYAGRDQTSVFEVDRPSRSALHPNMKPPELIARHLRNSSQQGDIGYEPFTGSGSTFVAAERMGRLCYGAELDPCYVAVALQRLADMGLKPEKETHG